MNNRFPLIIVLIKIKAERSSGFFTSRSSGFFTPKAVRAGYLTYAADI
ncbi:hypothetical protein KW548_23585 [Vibrio neptunius]|nr:hypothetical protein [Vibrio neptunius]QXX08581.1 hypothetical protein KW548_23585 [Vibrio neptunius]